ncbi:MAG: VOC family protein [Deltaproteobacteria bacterium]|nr:VOC family protein [Deltaproteobacteria bacterium]
MSTTIRSGPISRPGRFRCASSCGTRLTRSRPRPARAGRPCSSSFTRTGCATATVPSFRTTPPTSRRSSTPSCRSFGRRPAARIDVKSVKLRVARPTNQLERISEMYRKGLGLEVLGAFDGHEGYDGVMLGAAAAPYHFEFTRERGHQAPRCPSEEHLLVFYVSDPAEWQLTADRMLAAGFIAVASRNPYWDRDGRTFEDPEGYRVVLSRTAWSK